MHFIIRTFAGLILFFLFSSAFGQKAPAFKLYTFRHDFGTVKEKAGKLTHTFLFENAGTDTLRILKVKTSGSNVTAEVIPEKSGPGQKGEIRVYFDPAGESGKVEKYISIRSNDPEGPARQLSFMAIVEPSEKTTLDYYPQRLGNLALKAKHLVFDQFKNTEVRTDTYRLYNAWKQTMKLKIMNPPDYTLWSFHPSEIPPGREGYIVVSYDAGKSNNWGLYLDSFVLETNDSLEPHKVLTIGLNIMEDFSYVKDKETPLPLIEFTATTCDFGKLKQGEKVSFDYVFKNKGKGELIIRRVRATCGCTVAEPEKTRLKSGEESKISVTFQSEGMSGVQNKSVMVYCNDPANPVTYLSFTADVGTP